MVPATGELPRLAVGLVASGRAGLAKVRVWSSSDASTPLKTQGTVSAVTDDVVTVKVAGTEDVSAISGHSWDGSTESTFLLTSTDRKNWSPVELDAKARAVQADRSGAEGFRIVLAGDGMLSRHPAVVVHNAKTGETTTTALPAPRDGENQGITGVAVVGRMVVVTAERGPHGDLSRPVSYVSTDAGQTFSAAHEIGGSARAGVSGVVWTGTEFVATGADRSRGEADSHPSAWASDDGVKWSREQLAPLGSDPYGWADAGKSSSFGNPTVTKGEVAVATTQVAETRVYLRYRRANGTWTEPVATAAYGSAELSAGVVRTSAGFSAVVEANGSVSEFVTIDRRSPVKKVLNAWSPTFRFESLNPLPGAVGVAATQLTFEFEGGSGGSWRQFKRPGSYTFASGAFTERRWGPAELQEYHGPISGTDHASGTSVIAAWTSTADGFPMRAWTRLKGGRWLPVNGVREGRYQEPEVIEKTSAGWLMAVTAAPSPFSDVARVAALWSSPDGVNWTEANGKFQSDPGQDSRISAICELPGGPIVVGWAIDAEKISHATAWKLEKGRWMPHKLRSEPGAYFSSCTATESGARISGWDGAQHVTWTTSNLDKFTVAQTLERGVSRDAPIKVDGGFVATGSIESPAHTGPVLWFSEDGATWRWVSVPVVSRYADVLIAPVDGDLLVTADAGGNAQAWTIPDLASVLKTVAS